MNDQDIRLSRQPPFCRTDIPNPRLHGQDHDSSTHHNSTERGSGHAHGTRPKGGSTRDPLRRRHFVDAGGGVGQKGIGLGLIVRGGAVGRHTTLVSRHKGGNSLGVGVVARKRQEGVVLLATRVGAGIVERLLLGSKINGAGILVGFDASRGLCRVCSVIGCHSGLQTRILVDDRSFSVTDGSVAVDAADQEEERSDNVFGVDKHGGKRGRERDTEAAVGWQ